MRLIDADALIKLIEDNICKPCRKRKDDYKGVRCKACQYGDEKDDIDSAPTIQTEIIRCKDCKYCDRGIDEDGNQFLKCLGWVYGGTQEEDFCSHAERRTDG